MKKLLFVQIACAFALLVLFVAAGPRADAQQKTPPPPGPARPVNLPKITERKLSNGLTVILAPLPNVPKITSILSFRTGKAADREKHPGIAQLVAAVANEGTETRSSKQIKEELRSIGGSLSLFTDYDSTNVFATSLSESAAQLFALMSDVVQHPSFPETEVALAKANTIQSINAQRAEPNFLAGERLQKAIFGTHPYSFVVADEKSISALTRDDLKQFSAAHFVPNNAHLIVVGDFNPEATFAQIEKIFGQWKSGNVRAEELPTLPARDRRQIYFVNRPGSIQSTIYMGNATIPRKGQDYFALRTADTIFGGSFYSRLTKNIRESKGYTYSPFSASNTMAKAGFFQLGAAVRNEVTGLTLLEIFYELDRIRVAPVTDEELAAAKAYSTGNFAIELASQAGLASRINTIYTYDLPRDFITNFRPRIEALTPADIQRAAARYFDTYRTAVVIVGDYEKVKDQVNPFGDVTLFDAQGNIIK
ncbi:MAG TPA: pitrilysin family protein [Pyrinomonadaceae bacterium]|jgi:zinc protease